MRFFFPLATPTMEAKFKNAKKKKGKKSVSSNKLPGESGELKASVYDTGNLEIFLRRQQDTRQKSFQVG